MIEIYKNTAQWSNFSPIVVYQNRLIISGINGIIYIFDLNSNLNDPLYKIVNSSLDDRSLRLLHFSYMPFIILDGGTLIYIDNMSSEIVTINLREPEKILNKMIIPGGQYMKDMVFVNNKYLGIITYDDILIQNLETNQMKKK